MPKKRVYRERGGDHEHFFSPLCKNEVNGRFDAVIDDRGDAWVIDVGTQAMTRYTSYDYAQRAAMRLAKAWKPSRKVRRP